MPPSKCASRTSAAIFLAAAAAAASAGAIESVPAASAAAASEAALEVDDECSADQAGSEACALNAIQLRGKTASKASLAAASESAEGAAEAAAAAAAAGVEVGGTVNGIWHYALPCYSNCGSSAGYCDHYCGNGNACCKYLNSADPPECHTVRFFPVTYTHTCATPHLDRMGTTTLAPDYSSFENRGGGGGDLVFTNPLLYKPSDAPVMKFYMYRVQSDENYSPENQNLGNIPGMLWYLHNEIVWHPGLKRSGTYFSTKKTRLEKFRVWARATQPLFELGINFSVVNAFDSTKCTGPYQCNNFKEFGYAVGCETWVKGSGSDFPHGQWDGDNVYPHATWYSLPGPCPTKGINDKTAQCIKTEPGGACSYGGIPTGAGDCAYHYEKVGEISIDELEGIDNEEEFKQMNGMEYNKWTDHGTGTTFWDNKHSVEACQARVRKAEQMFKDKYPHLEDLPDPVCDFSRWKVQNAMAKAGTWR